MGGLYLSTVTLMSDPFLDLPLFTLDAIVTDWAAEDNQDRDPFFNGGLVTSLVQDSFPSLTAVD